MSLLLLKIQENNKPIIPCMFFIATKIGRSMKMESTINVIVTHIKVDKVLLLIAIATE